MALTRNEKENVVTDISSLLSSSKMTVIAAYTGTTVKAMQELRRRARENGTNVRVVKNRLVIKALAQNDSLKSVETAKLIGQLVYAFNGEDEVAAAQVLAQFAKSYPTIEFIGAISADGKFLSAETVKSLATLPSKQQLIAEVVATLTSPLNDVVNGLSGNLHALLDGVSAKAAN